MARVREIVVGYVEVDLLAYLPYFVTQERCNCYIHVSSPASNF